MPCRQKIRARHPTKSQTVIPKAVRDKLAVGPGELVEFEIRDGEVLFRRAPATDRVDPFAVFHEWSSEADEEAFADL